MNNEKPYQRIPPEAEDSGDRSSVSGSLLERLRALWAHASAQRTWLILGSTAAVIGLLLIGLIVHNLTPQDPKQQPGPAISSSPTPEKQPQEQTDKKDDAPPSTQPQTPTPTPKKGSGGASGGGAASGGSSGGGPGGGGSPGGGDSICELPNYPGASCTGPTGNLPLYTGSIDFRTDGEVIENVEIRINQGLNIAANNVTFRNVRVVFIGTQGEDFTMANVNDGTVGTVFESSEFDGQNNVERAISGVGTNVTVRKCNIHNTANGVEVSSPLLVEESYIHDIFSPTGTGWHADGIQVPYGSDNITIRHNTIILTGGETSAVSAEGQGGNLADNVLIENNLFAGGGYTLYTGPGGSNYNVINNHLSIQIWPRVGQFGAWYNIIGVTRSGNVIHETGLAANDNVL